MPPTIPSTLAASTLQSIDANIAEQHLLKHPFYEAWSAGTLPREAMLDYVGQYYAFESNLPRFLTALHSRCDDASVRAALLANAWDEEHGANNHPELWLRFGEALGLDRAAIMGATLRDTTRALVDTYREAAQQAPVEAGVAVLYAYESQLPAVAAAKIEGLRKHYGIEDRDGLAFFEVHRHLDVHHAAEERRVLEQSASAVAAEWADRALKAWSAFLTGIEISVHESEC
jgi:pyrroloquinoline-quinone synthase